MYQNVTLNHSSIIKTNIILWRYVQWYCKVQCTKLLHFQVWLPKTNAGKFGELQCFGQQLASWVPITPWLLPEASCLLHHLTALGHLGANWVVVVSCHFIFLILGIVTRVWKSVWCLCSSNMLYHQNFTYCLMFASKSMRSPFCALKLPLVSNIWKQDDKVMVFSNVYHLIRDM